MKDEGNYRGHAHLTKDDAFAFIHTVLFSDNSECHRLVLEIKVLYKVDSDRNGAARQHCKHASDMQLVLIGHQPLKEGLSLVVPPLNWR